jgi:hypothetical protein
MQFLEGNRMQIYVQFLKNVRTFLSITQHGAYAIQDWPVRMQGLQVPPEIAQRDVTHPWKPCMRTVIAGFVQYKIANEHAHEHIFPIAVRYAGAIREMLSDMVLLPVACFIPELNLADFFLVLFFVFAYVCLQQQSTRHTMAQNVHEQKILIFFP